jgi:hypothetical protein
MDALASAVVRLKSPFHGARYSKQGANEKH